MSRRIEFVVEGNPIPKARPRVVLRPGRKAAAYTPNQTKAWERDIEWVARGVMDGDEPLAGPLAVELAFYRGNEIGCDVDNLAKAVLDALNGVCYGDDAQVDEMHLYRAVDRDRPRVEVEIWQLEDGA